MAAALPVLNVHTPTSSFSIVHSLTQDSLQSLYDKLSRKQHTPYYGQRVGPGWLKYEFNSSIWNLDDDSDYTIFTWRYKQSTQSDSGSVLEGASQHTNKLAMSSTPTLYLHNPMEPLPAPPVYVNPSYYVFASSKAPSGPEVRHRSPGSSSRSKKSQRTKGTKGRNGSPAPEDDGVPTFRKDFEKFHSENGVRTVMGGIGPVNDVRMLLKSGYRNVYISRKFAIKHGFIPKDATPGYYGYGGLVNIGTWPVTVRVASVYGSQPNGPEGGAEEAPGAGQEKEGGLKPTLINVYLSEEPHFDVVLGRSFFEKRQIRVNPHDPTDVVCMDTGEKLECELVILKDGRGQIVTVT